MRKLVFAAIILGSATAIMPAGALAADAHPGVTWTSTGAAVSAPSPVQAAPMPPSQAPRAGWVAGQTPPPPPPPAASTQPAPVAVHRTPRWGSKIGGRWSGGMEAPGGWKAYRRPHRGTSLPGYWISPSFYIGDFGTYGLASPPPGYHWSRYYDDAVLIDDYGRVDDVVGDLDWDRIDLAYAGPESGIDRYERQFWHDGAAYPPPPSGPPPSSVVVQQPGVQGYSQTWSAGGYPPPPPPGQVVVQQGYSQSYSAGGYYAGGYWYPPVATTTVTIQSVPVVTTTTTEYVETRVYQAKARRAYRAPKKVVRRCCCCCR
jgi:Ni/Co efflux regulator RcnB